MERIGDLFTEFLSLPHPTTVTIDYTVEKRLAAVQATIDLSRSREAASRGPVDETKQRHVGSRVIVLLLLLCDDGDDVERIAIGVTTILSLSLYSFAFFISWLATLEPC